MCYDSEYDNLNYLRDNENENKANVWYDKVWDMSWTLGNNAQNVKILPEK